MDKDSQRFRAIVSANSRIRHPEEFSIGVGSILDDFCYISTRLRIGRFTHVASGCSIAGGAARLCEIGDFCSLSSGVKVWCASDDFVNDLVCSPMGAHVKEHLIEGDVVIGRSCAIGSNSVIMPRNHIPDGVSIGALSFVPTEFPFEPYWVYAGVPIRKIKPRNRENVERQATSLEAMLGRFHGENGPSD